MPTDIAFGLPVNYGSAPGDTEKWQLQIKEAYELGSKCSQKSAGHGKNHYDQKGPGAALITDDIVLVQNVSERGRPSKLRSYWEDKIHLLLKRKGDSSVYDVKAEDEKGCIRCSSLQSFTSL